MVATIERGGDPFDWWAPDWVLGYPVMRTYQGLGHLIVALVYFALFKSVSLMTVFVWVRFFSVALLPLTFFATARLLSLSYLTAGAAALLAPLISTPGLYGLEYGSYLWAGSGLFTQAIAMHVALLAIGLAYNAIRRRRHLALTGILVGLTFLAHFIYGYIAALTICLLAVMPDAQSRAVRLGRTVWVGAIALAVSAFELIPLLLDAATINRSRWEHPWKWDSFGAGQVIKWAFSGELLDHNRLPVLSGLVIAGIAYYFRDRATQQARYPARTFVMLGAALWILMFFGRPFWGPALSLVGVSPDMQLHRVIGGAHIFLILAAAIGLSAVWRELSRFHVAAAALVTALLFSPMVWERGHYLLNNKKLGEASLAAYNANRASLDIVLDTARNRGGRVYAGLPLGWGGRFKVGNDVHLYDLFSVAHIPALSFMYHSMSLTSEIMTRFQESRPDHYRLFDIQTVVAPQGIQLPAFLTPIRQDGPYRILASPGGGIFDVVDAFYAVKTNKFDFYDIVDRWLQSPWVANRQHLVLDFFGDANPALPRLDPDQPLPAAATFPFPGTVLSESQETRTYRAQILANRASYVLFKMTWHKNWRATVDGAPVRTAMLSPGFVGIPIQPGRHAVEIAYRPEAWKSVLAFAGIFLALLAVFAERRGYLAFANARVGDRLRLIPIPRASWVRVSALVVLALPVILPLFSTQLIEGHDATEYLPRQVEFHQDIAHRIVVPRWAPDLSNGAGQPLFLFNPPMIYYAAEIWRLAGFDYVTAINLGCVLLVLASAAGMFLLGSLYFGEMGGFLSAAAYLYAPYFAVDLLVRSSWAEFAAFPFFAFALYGFGAFAKFQKTKYLLIGAAGYAGVMLSHNAAALLFAPVLAGFCTLTAWWVRSWKVLWIHAAGFALALGLSAFMWLPSLALDHLTQVRLLLEGRSNYTNHFVFLHQFFDSPWGYGFSLPGDQDGMSFSLGIGHLLLVLAAIVFVLRQKQRTWVPWLAFFAGMTAILCFLMLPASRWIWDRIRLLQYISFPWRMLGPVTVCIAALIACLGAGISTLGKSRRLVFGFAMALLIAPNLSHLHAGKYRNIDSGSWSPHQIAQNGIRVSSFGEYRPVWMQEIPAYRQRPLEIVSGHGFAQQTGRSPVSWNGEIKAASSVTAEMFIAYFPCWHVWIDGKETTARPADRTGLLRFDIPQGDHQIAVVWTRNAVVWIADGLSALALCFLIAALVPARHGPFPRPQPKTVAGAHAYLTEDIE